MIDKPIIFLGSSIAMQLFVDVAHRQNLTIAGIMDSDYYGNKEMFMELPILWSEEQLSDPTILKNLTENYYFFIATNSSPDVGHSRDVHKRKRLIDLVNQYNLPCISIIDPSAFIGSRVELGKGLFIGYNVSIDHDVKIGDFSQIYTAAVISHGCIIGKNTIIQRVCQIGNTEIGNNVYVGLWSHVYGEKGLTVGNDSIIYQGLHVSRSVEPNEVVRLTKDSIRVYRNIMDV
jgi:carbonic anhydrase/acetyltransferase-like protein (isoleucine patch superfamily)